MTPTRVLRQADRVASPWANGGGITYQVLASPEGAGLDDFDWRISFADVASEGPFSPFPGVDRVLVLTHGEGMTLVIDDQPREVRPFEPIAFAGESAVVSRLPLGPTADLNVMTRRGRVQALVEVTSLRGSLELPAPAATELIVVLEGTCSLEEAREDALGPRDCLLLGAGVQLHGQATLARVRLLRL